MDQTARLHGLKRLTTGLSYIFFFFVFLMLILLYCTSLVISSLIYCLFHFISLSSFYHFVYFCCVTNHTCSLRGGKQTNVRPSDGEGQNDTLPAHVNNEQALAGPSGPSTSKTDSSIIFMQMSIELFRFFYSLT